MSIPPRDALWNAVAELAQLLLHDESVTTILQRVAGSSVDLIDAVEEAGMTVVHDQRPVTDAATGGLAFDVDNFQYEIDQGPCLHALLHGEVIEIPSLAGDQRWPAYARFAADRGINSSLSVPLTVARRATVDGPAPDPPSLGDAVAQGRIGVMNLYSRREGPFSDEERWAAVTYGQAAAAVVANARSLAAAHELAGYLQWALESRASIEQAKGVLMSRQGITADEAFDQLRARSQADNRKLRDLAQDLIDEVGADRESVPD